MPVDLVWPINLNDSFTPPFGGTLGESKVNENVEEIQSRVANAGFT